MFLIIRQICGDKLGATDGEIGHVKDLYFDDQSWAVRYLVADTGSWMPGRLVLLSPYAIGSLYQPGRMLLVNLTRQQIENSPSIESHKPVSRQYEEEYHRYYNWPFYWEGGQLWGMDAIPGLPPSQPLPSGPVNATKDKKQETGDAHLRSARAITGCHIQADDETIGHVTDFAMDDKTWVIQDMVVDTGHRFSGKRVLISPRQIKRIVWEESKVFVNLTKKAVLESPVFNPAAFGIVEHDPRILM